MLIFLRKHFPPVLEAKGGIFRVANIGPISNPTGQIFSKIKTLGTQMRLVRIHNPNKGETGSPVVVSGQSKINVAYG